MTRMSTSTGQESNPLSESSSSSCAGELGWLLSGFVMPLGSFSFFRKMAQRRVGMAILFFFIFTLTVSTISSIAAAEKLNSFSSEIRKSFQDGTIPEIVIRNGTAEVNGPQPAVLLDETNTSGQRIFVAIDTTGTYNQIDRTQYDEGFLLTRTDFQLLNNTGRYQTIPLSELNTAFKADPLIINAETMVNAWAILSIILVIAFFILLVIWNSLVRLMFLAAIALIFWGLISLFRPNTDFGPIIISGIYAIVPVIYINFLFGLFNISFPFLQTILLIPLWIFVLFAFLSKEDFFTKDRPSRLWRALLGIPMLLAFVIGFLFTYQNHEYVSLGTAILTILVLAAIGVYYRIQKPSGADIPTVPPIA
jgi:hypothetical protein